MVVVVVVRLGLRVVIGVFVGFDDDAFASFVSIEGGVAGDTRGVGGVYLVILSVTGARIATVVVVDVAAVVVVVVVVVVTLSMRVGYPRRVMDGGVGRVVVNVGWDKGGRVSDLTVGGVVGGGVSRLVSVM